MSSFQQVLTNYTSCFRNACKIFSTIRDFLTFVFLKTDVESSGEDEPASTQATSAAPVDISASRTPSQPGQDQATPGTSRLVQNPVQQKAPIKRRKSLTRAENVRKSRLRLFANRRLMNLQRGDAERVEMNQTSD